MENKENRKAEQSEEEIEALIDFWEKNGDDSGYPEIECGEASEAELEELMDLFGTPTPKGEAQVMTYNDRNKLINIAFVIADETSEYMYIAESTIEPRITKGAGLVVQFLYEHEKLGNRRLIYRDCEGQINEIIHDNGEFIRITEGHSGIDNLPG